MIHIRIALGSCILTERGPGLSIPGYLSTDVLGWPLAGCCLDFGRPGIYDNCFFSGSGVCWPCVEVCI